MPIIIEKPKYENKSNYSKKEEEEIEKENMINK